MELHADDYHASGSKEHLLELQKVISSEVLVKEFSIHGPRDNEKYERLQRPRHMMHGGTWVAENPRHIAQVKVLLGMEDCKPAPTPAVKNKKDTEEDKEALDEQQSSTYRSAVGILLYISHGRSDAQWAIGDLAKDIKHPTEGSMKRLKRCV